MNRFDHQWQKLTTLARQADCNVDCSAPYGFATRVTTQAARLPAVSPWVLMERFALRGLFAAAAFSLVAVALTYTSRATESVEDYTGADTVVETLGLS